MTENTIIAITASVCATIAPTIAAIAAYRQSKRAAAATKANDEKTDTLMEQVEVVRELTNGNLIRVQAELAALRAESKNSAAQIANLQELVRLLTIKPGASFAEGKQVAQLVDNESKSEEKKNGV